MLKGNAGLGRKSSVVFGEFILLGLSLVKHATL
jgi:hypothetical protein